MSLGQEKDLKSKLSKEIGCKIRGGGKKFALVYPNIYKIGMSNLGMHIIYKLLNSRGDISCERFFLPESKILSEIEKSGEQILSLETQTPLNKFQIVGFAISFEQDYFNVVKMLRLSKIKTNSSQRTKFDPLIIAGGPCPTFNPEPLSEIFDAFVIGEGEVILPPLIDKFLDAENFPREELLQEISEVPGIYVPKFKSKKISRQWLKNLDDFPARSEIIANDAEFNMYLIETSRGCGRHCRFCMAGYAFRKPRNRSLEILKAEVEDAEKFFHGNIENIKKNFGDAKLKNSKNKIASQFKIGLMGAAISDYPKINELCKFILEKKLPMSVASFRADSVTFELVEALAKSGLKTLTIAPEVGSEKMIRVINKGISEENVFNTVELGLKAGIKNFKLYFMIGLPFEEISDVEEIANLTVRLKNSAEKISKLTLSVNPFIPKPFTPFQWSKMADKKYLQTALKILREKLKAVRGVEIISESIKSAEIQGILSRGDKKIAKIVAESDSQKKFLELLKTENIDENFYLRRERKFDEVFAWDFLDLGVEKKYLIEEFQKAAEKKFTPPCFENCKRCGVCK